MYKRHSKSIDTDRMACSLCSGRLAFCGKFQANGTPARARGPNAFSDFVREHFAGVKAAHPAGPPQHLGSALQRCTCRVSQAPAACMLCSFQALHGTIDMMCTDASGHSRQPKSEHVGHVGRSRTVKQMFCGTLQQIPAHWRW